MSTPAESHLHGGAHDAGDGCCHGAEHGADGAGDGCCGGHRQHTQVGHDAHHCRHHEQHEQQTG